MVENITKGYFSLFLGELKQLCASWHACTHSQSSITKLNTKSLLILILWLSCREYPLWSNSWSVAWVDTWDPVRFIDSLGDLHVGATVSTQEAVLPQARQCGENILRERRDSINFMLQLLSWHFFLNSSLHASFFIYSPVECDESMHGDGSQGNSPWPITICPPIWLPLSWFLIGG